MAKVSLSREQIQEISTFLKTGEGPKRVERYVKKHQPELRNKILYQGERVYIPKERLDTVLKTVANRGMPVSSVEEAHKWLSHRFVGFLKKHVKPYVDKTKDNKNKSLNRYKIDRYFVERLKKGLQGRPDKQIAKVLTTLPGFTIEKGKVFWRKKEVLAIEDVPKILNDELTTGVCPMSIEAAYHYLKDKYVGALTRRNVEKFIKALESWQLTRRRQPNPARTKADYTHDRTGVTRFLLDKKSGGDWNHITCDLMYCPRSWSKYLYFLCVCHVRSGMCYFEPLSRRRAKDLIAPFKRVLGKIEEKFGHVKLLTSDDGVEFRSDFAKWLKAREIKHIHDRKSFVSERRIQQFGKTMGQLLGIGTKFSEALALTVAKINNTHSRVTGHKAIDVGKQTKLKPVKALRKGRKKKRPLQEYKVGDFVRFAKKNQEDTACTFYKAYGSTSRLPKHENWSRTVVKIKEKKVVFGNTLYKLDKQKKWKKAWEIQKLAAVHKLVIPKEKLKKPPAMKKQIASTEKQKPEARMTKEMTGLLTDLGTYWKAPVAGRRARKRVNYKE